VASGRICRRRKPEFVMRLAGEGKQRDDWRVIMICDTRETELGSAHAGEKPRLAAAF
jgi:hypothetical protein